MDSLEKQKAQWEKISPILRRKYPSTKTQLLHQNPLELIVSTILSAQCTDARVNMVTKSLFKKYKKARDYADANIEELEQDIKSTGFYKAKTRNIKAMAKRLADEYHGKVPNTMKELVTLAGVGRKTANIVLFHAFGKIEGIAVDTHVFRLSKRMGLTNKNDANKVEQDLMQIVPKKQWGMINTVLVQHGREICMARKPLCSKCPISKYCPKIGVKNAE
jgi:endonuclease-3